MAFATATHLTNVRNPQTNSQGLCGQPRQADPHPLLAVGCRVRPPRRALVMRALSQSLAGSGSASGEPSSSSGTSSSGGRRSSGGSYAAQEQLSKAEIEERVKVCENLIATSELLVPYDRSAVNLGLIVWGAIRDIPANHRHLLVDRLSSSSIQKLWKIAGQRFRAASGQAAATMRADESVWAHLPEQLGQIALFRGKAALPVHMLGISRFTKAFFLTPKGDALYGRVLLGKGPLGDWLYPMYFKASLGPSVVPMSNDLCDLTLEYPDPPELGLTRDDIPRGLWPQPRTQLAPFNECWTDYVRMAGPGVFVGAGMGLQRDAKPLHFIMCYHKTENLL